MPRPIVATVDLDALRHNLAVSRRHAGSARVWAVVKANAYGHGLLQAMRAFDKADGLALIEPDAAIALREAGWRKPLLMLEGFFDAEDLVSCIQHDIAFAVHSDEQIDMVAAVAAKLPGSQCDVWLKMNSGMNRLGFRPEQYAQAYARLRAIPAVRDIGMMTHFANADDPHNAHLPLAEQVQRFVQATDGLDGARCIANSAAQMQHPDLVFDWVRAGIMLYGATPGGPTAQDFGLRAAMTLSSQVIAVQDIRPGESVGYASRFVADKPMRIGVVACGYADGYPRHAPNGTPVIVHGVRTGTVGRVSMDMMAVDLTHIPDARAGSHVELWGEQLPIDEVADAAGTIGYELMCAVTARVPVLERNA